MHAYFAGSDQHNGRLPSHHLDFRGTGGYIVAPPSQAGGKPYRLISRPGGRGTLDWLAVTALMEPQPQQEHPAPDHASDRRLSQLARWLARQPEGNRNAGLYWAANHALDANPAADLSPLAAAARQAGLGEPRSPAPSTPRANTPAASRSPGRGGQLKSASNFLRVSPIGELLSLKRISPCWAGNPPTVA
jgi:Bifunctional DNA primase/polymerase, N-terminal